MKKTGIDIEGLRTPNCHSLREETSGEKKFVKGNEGFEEQTTPLSFLLMPIF